MYSNKLSRLVLGLYRRKAVAVCGVVVHSPAGRSTFSWAAVCKQRTLWLQRSASLELRLTSTRSASQTTVDPDEVKKFQSLASKWWDEQGEFGALHAMNDLRVPFIRALMRMMHAQTSACSACFMPEADSHQTVCEGRKEEGREDRRNTGARDNLLNVHRARHPGKPLAGLRILDVGCGGGLLTEPLGRLGADVVGIDPVENSIGTAQLHASYDPDLRERVCYRVCTLEELSAEEEEGGEEEEEQRSGQFDAVVASEVVEHLADLETFAFCCSHVLKPGGSLFITTINKTNLSYALGIVVAEQLLRIVPSGTHDWEKFISPVELERLLESNGFSVQSVQGMLYNPISGAWSWTDSTAINYALHAVKLTEDPQPDPHPEDPAHTAATHS
ncbi:ubiquinone biosynthesis O-methyltransferase, mitochondrial isoform X1 [Thunnus maccoyii]|uniref:ubiquinone biosynthesis O-methyltransferase, mitochondrial isoform X1 n=1 Tax=Thunnus maccoyii TaxID=8240 RepID=UPI001C4CE941|nr:ubiquinone biosynthesis O-methyltransferase, mitochondrial isoform X1 [Thunnus maccoyii]